MARKRMIDPEFWSDQEIGFWTDKAKLFYIGIWTCSDDEGRFKAHPSLLRSQIFPYELKVDIEALKIEIADKIQWYEVNNVQYGYVRNFLKYQNINRPTKSKLPKPQVDSLSTHTKFTEDTQSTHGGLTGNRIEENRTKENRNVPSEHMFETLWNIYPKKDGRKEALKHFLTSVKTLEDFEKCGAAVKNYKLHLEEQKIGAQYVKNGSTFFNNWQDWVTMPVSKTTVDGIPKEWINADRKSGRS